MPLENREDMPPTGRQPPRLLCELTPDFRYGYEGIALEHAQGEHFQIRLRTR